MLSQPGCKPFFVFLQCYENWTYRQVDVRRHGVGLYQRAQERAQRLERKSHPEECAQSVFKDAEGDTFHRFLPQQLLENEPGGRRRMVLPV